MDYFAASPSTAASQNQPVVVQPKCSITLPKNKKKVHDSINQEDNESSGTMNPSQ